MGMHAGKLCTKERSVTLKIFARESCRPKLGQRTGRCVNVASDFAHV